MLKDWNLFFDLDGTLTKKEILPIVAKELGLYDEINQLTQETIKGLIPFHESFIKRVDILKTVPISKVREIINSVPLNEKIVDFLKDNKNRCYIVTGNLDVWIAPLCEKIGVNYFSSIATYDGDYITEVSKVLIKADIVKQFNGLKVAVGEGNNDAEMIKASTIGIAYGGVHKPAKSVLEFATHSIYEEETLCRFLRQL